MKQSFKKEQKKRRKKYCTEYELVSLCFGDFGFLKQ